MDQKKREKMLAAKRATSKARYEKMMSDPSLRDVLKMKWKQNYLTKKKNGQTIDPAIQREKWRKHSSAYYERKKRAKDVDLGEMHQHGNVDSSGPLRRTSDAALSAGPSCSIKVEPEWGECGASDPAVAEGLYIGHEIKDELVFGPELVQQQDIVFSMQRALTIKEENLEKAIPADKPNVASECTSSKNEHHRIRSIEQKYGLRNCFVRLEQLPMRNLHTCKTCNLIFYCKLCISNVHSLCDCTFNVSVHSGTAIVKKICHLCKICRKQYEENNSLTCTLCNKQFSRKFHFDMHKLRHAGKEPTYSCDICHKKLSSKWNLAIHKQTHTGEKPYSCNICNRRFPHVTTLARHKKVHTGEKPYRCDICNKQFKAKLTLNNHKWKHEGEKPYGCDICYKRFTLKLSLTRHILIHTGEKPYSCAICNKRFQHTGALNRHKWIHADNNPYTCDICNRPFINKTILTRHKRVHTGEKPYSCNICNQSFAVVSTLNKHMRVHTGEKPFSSVAMYVTKNLDVSLL